MGQFDDLEALLKQAKTEAFKERVRKTKSTFPRIAIKRQAEQEWTVGKTVALIHKDEGGNETALGLFIEHLRNGGRWLRPTAESLSPDHCEIVTGSWWLHPSIREIPVDSHHEVMAIRARFEMLIQEFVEDNNLEPPVNLQALVEKPSVIEEDDDDDWGDYSDDEDEDEEDEDEDEDEGD